MLFSGLAILINAISFSVTLIMTNLFKFEYKEYLSKTKIFTYFIVLRFHFADLIYSIPRLFSIWSHIQFLKIVFREKEEGPET